VEYVTDYFSVVVCKNRRVHHKGNTGYEHKILLGEADAFSSLPMLPETINVRSDSSGEEYSYMQKEVMRDEVSGSRTVYAAHAFQTVVVRAAWFRHERFCGSGLSCIAEVSCALHSSVIKRLGSVSSPSPRDWTVPDSARVGDF
jgi:hypothetical protein